MEKKYYKFRSERTENLQDLLNCKIRLSCLEQFNDAFEGYVVFRNQEMVSKDKYDNKMGEYKDRILRRKFYCLASSDDPNYIEHCHLMWAHYANGHRGFCIEFNENILNGFPESKTGESKTSIKVEYPDTFSVPEIYLDDNSYVINEQLFYQIVSKKGKQWKYENEVRLVLKNEEEHKISQESISAIYVGAKIDGLAERTLVGIAKKLEVPCFKMELSESYYELVKNPL